MQPIASFLQVHASSPSINTPQGQNRRAELLEILFDLVHVNVVGEQGARQIDFALFNCEKGQKLLAELVPLWPQAMVHLALGSFVQLLSTRAREQSGPVARVLATCLANAPKRLQPDQCESLLRAITAHGGAILKQSLQRADVSALLLGILCAQDQSLEARAAFYGVLLPLATSSEPPWSLLNAVLPTVDANHAALLQQAIRCALVCAHPSLFFLLFFGARFCDSGQHLDCAGCCNRIR